MGAIVCALTMAIAGPARAQSVAPPPVFPAVDPNGVDVTTGGLIHAQTDVAIGQPGNGGLEFTRSYRSAPFAYWTHNHMGYLAADGGNCKVVLGAATETFTATQTSCQGTFTSDQQRGSSLSYNSSTQIYTYTSSNGAVATFTRSFSGLVLYGAPSGALGYLTALAAPDGEVRTYSYDFSNYICYPDPQNCIATFRYARLNLVSNNLGYRLSLEYPGPPEQFTPPNRVTGINTAVEFCSGSNCSGSWPYATYTADANGSYLTATSAASKTTTYTYSNYQISKIRFPDQQLHDVDVTYNGARVATINRGVGASSYAYVDAGTDRTTTVTNPDATTRVYVSWISTGRVKSFTDELNRTVAYQYDGASRATKITQPEGNATQVVYDARGNITESREISKTPGTPADVVTSATFPASCTNAVTCNKPTSTTDAAGYRTDYTYDATHGGVLTITAPAPSGGTPVGSGSRPQTRHTYAQFQARYQASSGSWVNGSAVWRLSTVSSCATGVAPACLGTADETRTTYGYPSSGTANNVLPTSATSGAGNSSVSTTTTMTYTDWGDVKTLDGPGGADTVRFYYDNVRRRTGMVGPDPDGGGTLLYRAERVTYNSVGQPTIIERGTVPNQGDTAFNSFASLEKQDAVYDSLGRTLYARLWDGGSIVALSQYSYDSRGRPLCSAARMTPATYGSLPDACTQVGSPGSFGADRISRTLYDGAGQVTQVQSAYGTALAQTTATYTYTPNGQVETLTDARSYRTTYEYDGLDRRVKHRYPAPGSPNTSSATDYDLLTYDSIGRLAFERRRSGESFGYTYDNLQRVTFRDAPGTQPDVSYTYDLQGRVTYTSQSGNAITTTYDALSRITSEASSVLGTVSYQYNASGRRSQLSYPGSFYVTYTYNDAGDLTGILENGSSSLATYAYDNLGRRTSLTRGNGVVTTFGFDAASRLASLIQNPTGTTHDATVSFGYNPAGQMTSRARSDAVYDWSVGPNVSESAAADGLNQYTSALGVTPSYDSRGNLTGDGTRTYAYDFDNRLISASGGINLKYDPLDRLHEVASATTTTRFLYDGQSVIAEYNASGAVVARYVHGPGVDEPLVWYQGSGTGNRRWMIADERGSVIGLSDGSGAVTHVNKYDAFGVPNPVNQGRFQYTGQMWIAELGLYHYKARAYHPRLGRFMQADPIGYAGGMNLYAYAGNDPVNLRDPNGLCPAAGTEGHPNYDCLNDMTNGWDVLETVEVWGKRFTESIGAPATLVGVQFNPGNGFERAWNEALAGLAADLGIPPTNEEAAPEEDTLQCPTPDAAILNAPPSLDRPPTEAQRQNANTLVVDLGEGRNALTLGIKNLDDPFAARLHTPLTAPINLDITFNITSASGTVSQSFRLSPMVPPGQSWFQTFRNRFTGPGSATFNIVNRSPYRVAVTLRATPMSCIGPTR